MRTILFLLLSWALSPPCATAQTRAAGPWRVVNQPVRYKLHTDWGEAEEWGAKSSPTAKGDTTTAVRVQRKLYRVPWNVHPDSVTLFLDCQNPLIAPNAHRGRAPIRFVATGATVRLDPKQHLLLLAPSASVVVLWAYRGQHLVFQHKFKVMPPPLPILKCFLGGCNGTIKQGIANNSIRTITLRAIPDKDFAAILPDDARYRVARFRTTLLQLGKTTTLASGQPAELTVQGPQGDLSDFINTSQFGDQLQTDILVVQRMNFRSVITKIPIRQRFTDNIPKCPGQE